MNRHHTKYYLFVIVCMGLMMSVCPQASEVQDKQAMLLDELIYLDQNWDETDREWFYFVDQGSRLLPSRIFMNLEQAGNQKLFSDSFNLLGLGFLPAKKSKFNPDGLPVGFSNNDGFVGLTCAACHTQQIKYEDKFIRIDGGQSMIDLAQFRLKIESSMKMTLNDKDKYSRFEKNVLGENTSEKKKANLKKEFEKHYSLRKENNGRNNTKSAYGYSRLDAFGAILNKALLLTGVKDNFNEPDAPTSYPYIWDTPQHDYVEWDGSQSNSSIGALARNVGEVIGVFGEVEPVTKKWLFFVDGGYPSSIQASNLREIEKKVATLYSPLWPDFFPDIDQEKTKAGRVLYKKHCLSCHQDINRTDPGRKIKARMSTLDAIQTDPWMARNVLEKTGKTGIFKGRPRFYTVGEVLGEEAPALYIVNNLMGGVLKNNPIQSLLAIRDAENAGHPEEIHPPKYVDGEFIERGQEVSEKALLAYKARPMNGIWTGGPFLHNGSVPNLYELLLSADQRSTSFYIGSWEFDPVKVGYVDDERPGSFFFDTTLKGNSNAGHEYGTGDYGTDPFTEDEIWALVEYMKTL
jgi:processive rubber oxygenase RoxA-like protein